MVRKEAKKIVNDLIDNVYCDKSISKKWDIQFGHNPWFSLGVHIDHCDPSITLHLPGVLIYIGNCKQPGFQFWNKMAPKAIQEHSFTRGIMVREQKLRIPLVSRLICKYLWHSWTGILNQHGAMQWLVCTRCGERYDVISCTYVGRKL